MEIKPCQHRAHYYETDQMGIVHHSNYIRWFEEARVDFMEQMGFGYRRMEEEGISSPVLGVECTFKSMTRFHDLVEIQAKITRFTGAKMEISYRITDVPTGLLRAEGKSRHGFLNAAGRPISLKKENPEMFRLFHQLCTEES